MKTKILFLFTCLIVLSSFKPIQQIDDTQLYKVIIFKLVKNEKGEEKQKVVLINQNGNIIIDNKLINNKVDIKSFNQEINNFIKSQKLIKEKANNEPPKMDIIPNDGEQFISIIIVKLEDYKKEMDYANPSQYIYRQIKKSSEKNILYKYLKSDDLNVLKNKLD
ncbi:hypothetical protein [Flavobacterium sp.]|uniref:hypothetical protein n=1 Tax=Flavobacterium sp. TaxID=239 RepID=UPI0025F6F28C|nr:hypothetical protein [Flavobacterium sp.]